LAVAFFLKAALCVATLMGLMAQADAQESKPVSFAGKRVNVLIGFSTVGFGYDTYGRILARYLGRHLPGNPSVVPQNRPGAGSMALANYMYNVARRDGTEIALIGRGVAADPVISGTASTAKFDATKFNWLGSMNNEVAGFFLQNSAPAKTLDEVLAGQPLTVGSTGVGGDPYMFAVTANAILGTKLKLIAGYPGMNEILLGMENGELDGVLGYSWGVARLGSATQIRDGRLKIILQLGLQRHKELTQVPLIVDLVKDETDRKILELVFSRQSMGRPVTAPPALDPPVAAALRQGFADTMHDPEFLSEADRLGLEVSFVGGDDVQRLVDSLYAMPKDVVGRAQKIVAPDR
jgi:tripartite-type tricarboxylate transporter receptor subunit TctC